MVNDMMLTRRHALAGLALSGAALLAGPGLALSTSAAESLVVQLSSDITKAINSGKSDAAMIKNFESIFARYADVPTIARFSLGAAARTASPAEISAYTAAFTGYISRKYGRRFREFEGGSIEVTGSRTDKNLVLVAAVAKMKGKSPIAVEFQVSDRSGRDAFINVVIEGINMLTTERTEIAAMLDAVGRSVPKLTEKLKTT